MPSFTLCGSLRHPGVASSRGTGSNSLTLHSARNTWATLALRAGKSLRWTAGEAVCNPSAEHGLIVKSQLTALCCCNCVYFLFKLVTDPEGDIGKHKFA